MVSESTFNYKQGVSYISSLNTKTHLADPVLALLKVLTCQWHWSGVLANKTLPGLDFLGGLRDNGLITAAVKISQRSGCASLPRNSVNVLVASSPVSLLFTCKVLRAQGFMGRKAEVAWLPCCRSYSFSIRLKYSCSFNDCKIDTTNLILRSYLQFLIQISILR